MRTTTTARSGVVDERSSVAWASIWALLPTVAMTAAFWSWIDRRLDAIPIRPALFGALAVPTYSAVFFAAALVLCLALALLVQVLVRAATLQRLEIVPLALVLGVLLLAAVGTWRPLTSERQAKAAESSDLRYEEAERLLTWAVGYQNVSVAKALALNPRTPPAVLERIARLDWPGLRSAGPGFQDILRGDLRSTKRILAQREDLPSSALVHLAADPATDIVSAAARNPSTPLEILESLAGARVPGIRAEVARNPTTPVVTMEKLSGDEDSAVRLGLSENRRAPRAVLERLAQDPDPRVRAAAAKRLATPGAVQTRMLVLN